MEDDARVTDFDRNRIGDLTAPASDTRDLLGDLVVGAFVERRLPDFDVVGDRSHRVDTLCCSHGDVLLVDGNSGRVARESQRRK